MFTHRPVRLMRVLCLTMIPGGGALTPALIRLGYTPYHLLRCFQDGNASSHTTAWAEMLKGDLAFQGKRFATYDSLVGPPTTLLYDSILRDCPGYTKVVLVVEPRKDQWAEEYDKCMETLRGHLRRLGNLKKFNAAFIDLIEQMVVRGGGDQADFSSTSLSNNDFIHSEGAAHPKVHASVASRVSDGGLEDGKKAKDVCMEAEATSSRAIALCQFEESVKIRVPAERLLVYRYGDGWGPLCAFLEKPIPDDPFPAYDNGLRMLNNLVEKVLFVDLIRRWLLVLFGLWLLFMLLPYFGKGITYFSEMFHEYSMAFGHDADSGAVFKSVKVSPICEVEESPR
ncbi:unnamed protein product [Phytomonas sp. Hart1]|nr:unnamed protein product [Phytomonas sp. Hart1]|eukprot:CCW71966.1 unnamed protein product [Phytomonas sp. isolate Hart1]